NLRLSFGLGPLQKHPLKNVRRLFLARNEHPGTSPGKTAQPLLHVYAKRQRRETGQVPDALGDVLIQRDGVAKTAAARMRRSREEAIVRRMSAIDVGMGDAAEDREIVAVLLEQFEIWRER